MNRITSGVHRTGGQFYDLYPAYVGPGLAPAASFVLVIRSNADERQRQTTSRRPVGP